MSYSDTYLLVSKPISNGPNQGEQLNLIQLFHYLKQFVGNLTTHYSKHNFISHSLMK